MTDVNASAEAPVDVSTPVETAHEPASRSMSLEEAAAAWDNSTASGDATATSGEPGDGEPTSNSAEADGGNPANDDHQDGGEPAAAGLESNEDEPPLDFDKLHGNTKLRLRDGTEITVGDLKKDWDGLRSLKQQQQEFDQRRQQFEELYRAKVPELQSLAQRDQYLTQILGPAIDVLERQVPQIPPYPDASLLETDPFQYQRQRDAYDRGQIAYASWQQELSTLKHEQHQRQQAEQQRQEAGQAQWLQSQRDTFQRGMLEKHKIDLTKDDQKMAVRSALVETAKTYGFTEDDVNGEANSKLLLMIYDLAKQSKELQQLKSGLPKPVNKQPTTQQAPVAAPGRRVPQGEAEAARRQELMAKARNNGRGVSLEEMARLMDQAG